VSNIKYLIPARKNSKGLPFKNRILFNYTAELLKNNNENVIVSSDDDFIKILSKKYKFNFHNRSKKNSSSKATTKDFVTEVIRDLNLSNNDIIVMLMLTYPNREISDVKKCIEFFNLSNSKSLLCKKDVKVSPYLMMFEKDFNLGEQVIKHNLCRRQDYKKVFEICHFISIFNVSEVKNLNNNLYNNNTIFYKLEKQIFDIDTKKDLENFYAYKRKNKNNCGNWNKS
tara:strand:- start:1296 stop:1976 length:681 start_codon:yes stop_codon:yes gene_type:complete